MVAAVRAVDPSLVFLGLAGGVATALAAEAGLAVTAEAFADRAYQPSGDLVSRNEPGSVLHDPQVVAHRMLQLVREGTIEAIDGTTVRVDAGSICVHGDSAGSVAMAAAVRELLESEGVTIAPFAGPSAA